jgi:hypothetical protein
MKISKAHQRISDWLEEPKVLTNPEDFLGPNWEDVINFWLYLDGLDEKEMDEMEESYWDLGKHVRHPALDSAHNASWVACKEVVGWEVRDVTRDATYDVIKRNVFVHATNELIAQHNLLEQDKALVFLPLCLKNYT